MFLAVVPIAKDLISNFPKKRRALHKAVLESFVGFSIYFFLPTKVHARMPQVQSVSAMAVSLHRSRK